MLALQVRLPGKRYDIYYRPTGRIDLDHRHRDVSKTSDHIHGNSAPGWVDAGVLRLGFGAHIEGRFEEKMMGICVRLREHDGLFFLDECLRVICGPFRSNSPWRQGISSGGYWAERPG